VSVLPITNTDHGKTEHLISDSLGNISWIQKATLQLYRRNVPLLHTSRYVIHMTQFYQAFPVLLLQVTNAGVRRPGYEATIVLWSGQLHVCTQCTMLRKTAQSGKQWQGSGSRKVATRARRALPNDQKGSWL